MLPDTEARIAMLLSQLQAKDDYIQSTHEELESSNEELKSSNEEMQSVNEELQSLNEELATVNAELNANVTDLSHANNDMNNLLAGTGIATVFVDPQLHILRFTPTASLLINLIPSDVGRPLGHIVSNLVGYDQRCGMHMTRLRYRTWKAAPWPGTQVLYACMAGAKRRR